MNGLWYNLRPEIEAKQTVYYPSIFFKKRSMTVRGRNFRTEENMASRSPYLERCAVWRQKRAEEHDCDVAWLWSRDSRTEVLMGVAFETRTEHMAF